MSFRAARIVAATRIVYFRSSIESSSGNGCGNHGYAKEQIDHVPILGGCEKRKKSGQHTIADSLFAKVIRMRFVFENHLEFRHRNEKGCTRKYFLTQYQCSFKERDGSLRF